MSRAAYPGRWLTAALLLGCLTGCKGLFGTQAVPEDPLFLHKTPLEGRAESSRRIDLAYSEPPPPVKPYFSQHRPDFSGLDISRSASDRLVRESDLPAKD